jgi:taurine dioxygenase
VEADFGHSGIHDPDAAAAPGRCRAKGLTAMSFEIRYLDAPLGAEILGLDLSEPVDDTELGRIWQTLAERGVLVFRDQAGLLPEQHVAFSRRFGPLQIHIQHHFHHPKHPEILTVSNVVENGRPIGPRTG